MLALLFFFDVKLCIELGLVYYLLIVQKIMTLRSVESVISLSNVTVHRSVIELLTHNRLI